MKTTTKKVIAREFLITLACIVVSFLAFCAYYFYNQGVDRQLREIQINRTALQSEINQKEKDFRSKIEKQEWFYNETGGETEEHKSYSELWKALNQIHEADSIVYRFNSTWDEDLKSFLKQIGFNNGEEFDAFIRANSLSRDELIIVKETDLTRLELDQVNEEYLDKNWRLNYYGQVEDFGIDFLILTSALAFPIRYLILAIVWSVRTLRQKD